MIILAIETSCDDTCLAIIEIFGEKPPHFKILSNIVSSQTKLHAKYGGVYPSLAKREHQKNLPIIFEKAKKEAGNPKIGLIAVTVGPGLEPCLWAGVNFAKNLAMSLNLPIAPINHIEAHIFANFVGLNSKFKSNPSGSLGLRPSQQNLFPAICLVVSGGHTQLILMKKADEYKILGETRDDAAGECFDKAARILGLPYPGGPAIAKYARQEPKIHRQGADKLKVKLPRPMIYDKNYDFSFSGLKTAVLYDFRQRQTKIRRSPEYIVKMCREIQQAIIDVLIYKTLKAVKEYEAKTLILGGGVAANEELRKQFKAKCSELKINLRFPPKDLCTDNALMGVYAAFFNKKRVKKINDIKALSNLRL